MRIGAKKRPFYRIVAVDERVKRNGAYIELLGTYNPLTEPHDIKLKQDRIDFWVKQGAVFSDGFLRITGKAPKRPPRKPKKEKKEESPDKTSETEKLTTEDEKPQENTNTPESTDTEVAEEKTVESGANEENEVVVDDSAENPQS